MPKRHMMSEDPRKAEAFGSLPSTLGPVDGEPTAVTK